MAVFLVSFVLPAIVWMLVIPLKIAVKITEKSLKLGYKSTKGLYHSFSQKDANLDISKNSGNNGRRDKLLKLGYKSAKFGLYSLLMSLKLMIKVINMLVRMLVYILTTTSALYTALIVGAIIAAVLIALAVSNSTLMSMQNTTTTSEPKSTSNAVVGSNFFSIDWSQNFNSQLDKIESKNGVEARNWVEMKIIEMNTAQKAMKDGNSEYAVEGFMTGLKAVESGQTSLASSKGMTTQEVRLNRGTLDTPMQFDTDWQKYNPYYTDYSRDKGGSKYYYPDAFFGITQRFSKAGVSGFLPKRTTPLFEKAFKDMGVEQTADKLRFVRYVSNISLEYNAIFLENTGYIPGLTKEKSNDAVYANAMLLIQFGEIYGYEVSDKTLALVRSMYAKDKDDKYNNWYYSKSAAFNAIYGMEGGSKSYPSDINNNKDYGVIDGNGKSVKGSLFSYLVSQMPSNAQTAMNNSQGLKTFNGSRSHYTRVRYDLTAYLLGVYDLWWASDNLGVFVGDKGNTTNNDNENSNSTDENSDTGNTNSTDDLSVSESIVNLASTYASDTSEDRLIFGHSARENYQDNASFVNGLLRELGYSIDGSSTVKRPMSEGNLTSIRTVSQMVDKIKDNNSILVNPETFAGENIEYASLVDSLEEGDILISSESGEEHVSIYVGTNSNRDEIVVESNTSNKESFKGKSDKDMSGEKTYGFGFHNLKDTGYSDKINYIVRLSNVVN